MARPRPTATTGTPTGAPRKPAGKATGSRSASGPQKARNGRESASKGTTAKAKPNPFDDIARQVNADLEAKDRAAGRDDLTPARAKSVDQAKTKRAATKPAKPARPAKVQVTGNGKMAFGGRPVSNPAKVAERVKQLGLRVRSDADVDAIAGRLRATPSAVSAWLEARNRKQPAKAKDRVKSKQQQPKQGKPAKVPTITLTRLWADKKPDWLYRCTLVTPVRSPPRRDGTSHSLRMFDVCEKEAPGGSAGSAFGSLGLDLDGFEVVSAELVGGEWQLAVQTTATMVGCAGPLSKAASGPRCSEGQLIF